MTESGLIVVREDGGPEQVLTLSGPNAELLEKVEARWGDLCRRQGDANGIHDGWLQAMIFRESGGNEHARNPDGGVGLGQITNILLKGGHTDLELEDPELNAEIMAHYVGDLSRRYHGDFPRVAAAYNAGAVYPPKKGFENPWGMHCTRGHITAEVSALNYYLQRPLGAEERDRILAAVFSTVDEFIRHDFERGITAPPPEPNA